MRYMPSRNPAQSGGGQPGNRGEGDPVNGYPFGSTTPGYIDYRDIEANGPFYPGTTRQRYQDDPNARKVHTPGSDRHSQEEKYFGREIGGVGPAGPPVEWNSGFYDQQHAGDVQRKRELLAGNEPYQKAKAAGDLKGQIAAMTAMRGQMQQDRFVAQGGTPETWQNRFDPNNNWPVPHVPGAGGGNGMVTPRSPSGNYQYGPGRPGPTPPGVPPQAAQAQALPPSQNPMITGYGGPGVVSGGQGGQFGSAGGSRMDMSNFARDEQMALQNARMRQGGTDWWNPGGGYNPGQSKSGMGQSPYGGGMSTGGDMSMDAYNPGGGMASIMAAMQGGGMGGGAPYYNPNAATMGGGMNDYLMSMMMNGMGGGMNDYLMSMMMNGMGGRMSPGQGFGGRSAFSMDPGMMGFGYAPMY